MDIITLGMAVNKTLEHLNEVGGAGNRKYNVTQETYGSKGEFLATDESGGLALLILERAIGGCGDLYWDVFWDGTVYRCDADPGTNGNVHIGNMSLVGDGDNTGEPFCIITDVEQYKTLIIAAEPGTHSFDIYRHHYDYERISQSYIPTLDALYLEGVDSGLHKIIVNESGELVAIPVVRRHD